MSRSKPTLVRLAEMSPGQYGDFFALLAERTRGSRRDGKPFFTCRFRDAGRAVTAMVWADGDWFETCEQTWQQGQLYKIRGVYDEQTAHQKYRSVRQRSPSGPGPSGPRIPL
jgi:3'-5' exoribonuclease